MGLTPEELDALKLAVQEAIYEGAPPESVQPINNWINRLVGGYVTGTTPVVPEPEPTPKAPNVVRPAREADPPPPA